jgi:hypothetical protein
VSVRDPLLLLYVIVNLDGIVIKEESGRVSGEKGRLEGLVLTPVSTGGDRRSYRRPGCISARWHL